MARLVFDDLASAARTAGSSTTTSRVAASTTARVSPSAPSRATASAKSASEAEKEHAESSGSRPGLTGWPPKALASAKHNWACRTSSSAASCARATKSGGAP